VSVGAVSVNVANGDPNAIAGGIGGALRAEMGKGIVAASNTGTRQ
jgi:hypothetical protein